MGKQKVVIFVHGGVVEEVLSDWPLDCILIDKDETDEDQSCELKDATDGTPFTASLTELPVSVDPKDTQHYWDQIPAR